MAWYQKAADNFDGADQDPFSRTGWVELAADDPALIESNKWRGPNAFAECWYKYTGASFADNQYCQGTVQFNPIASANDAQSYLFVRITDVNNLYRLNNYKQYFRLYLYKRVSGTFTLIGGAYQSGSSQNPCTHSLSAEGTTITSVDHNITRTWTDSSLTSGTVGIGGYTPPSTSYYVSFDDYTAGDDVAPPTSLAGRRRFGLSPFGANGMMCMSPTGGLPRRRGSEV